MKSKKPWSPPTQKQMADIVAHSKRLAKALAASREALKAVELDHSDFLSFMAQHLDQWPSLHHDAAPGVHADVPPCNWPELIASIVARAVKDSKDNK